MNSAESTMETCGNGRKSSFPLPPIIYTVICALFFVPLYYPAYQVMFAFWQGEDYNYCFLVPLVSLYILWEKRDRLRAIPTRPSLLGPACLLLGVVLYWLGELGGEFYTLYISSWLVFTGLSLAYAGRDKLKEALFPLCFLLAMFPFPNFINHNLTLRLKLISSQLGVALIQLYGMSAYREGNVIDVGFTRLQVVDACSGLRFFLPLIVLAILLAYYFRAAAWKRILLVLCAVPLSVVTNSLRIASVGILYQFWGAAVAEGFFHDFSGWFIFMVSLALLLGVMWLLKRLFPETVPPSVGKQETPSPGGAPASLSFVRALILAIPAVLLLGGTLLMMQQVDFREKTPLRVPFSSFPLTVGEWSGERQVMEKIYLDELGLSDYLLADYRKAGGESVSLYVAYSESQRKGKSSHTPETCLPGNGWVFRESGIREVRLPSGRSIRVKYALMEKNGQRMLGCYWFPQRGRVLHNLFELKLYAFLDALTKRRTDGALVRITTPLGEREDTSRGEARLDSFVGLVTPLLDRYLPGKAAR